MRKATAAAKVGSSAPSPVPGSESATGTRSLRRESPTVRYEGSSPGTPLTTSSRPLVSRNASTNTAVLRDAAGSWSPRMGSSSKGASAVRSGDQGDRRRLSSLPIGSDDKRPQSTKPEAEPASKPDLEPDRSLSPGPAESSSTTTSDDESSPAQSRIIRRPPRYQQQQNTTSAFADDEDEESEPAFQPYKPSGNDSQGQGHGQAQDLTSTLRGDTRTSSSRRGFKNRDKEHLTQSSQTSDSDTSSTAPVHRPVKSREQKASGPSSTRRATELATQSPGDKASREGSDGTPSMGSSFSDLDGMYTVFARIRRTKTSTHNIRRRLRNTVSFGRSFG